jgi:hypothetical protein
LKLHGSIGGWSVDIAGSGHPRHQRCIFEAPDPQEVVIVDDDYFSPEPPQGQRPDHLKRPPILYFPYHRQFIVSQESGFPYDQYAREVWKRATHLIKNATEIHVIGYSFSGIDRGEMLDMLSQASRCRRLLIPDPNSNRICQRIKIKVARPQLGDLIESAPYQF